MEKAGHESGQRLLAWGRTSLKSLDHLHLHVPSGDRLMAPMCSHWREAGRVMAIALGTLGIVCHWVGWIHASAFEHQDVGMFFWLNCSRFSTQFLKMEKMYIYIFFYKILSWTAPWLPFPRLWWGKAVCPRGDGNREGVKKSWRSAIISASPFVFLPNQWRSLRGCIRTHLLEEWL